MPAMLTTLRRFFEQRIAAAPDEPGPAREKREHLAAAALLVEVMRSDDRFADEERRAVLVSLQRRFHLDDAEAAELLALAETQARDAHDLFQFTSRINASFPPAGKVRLIEELWRVAYADAVLHKYEEHFIRRVADLLHVPHSAFIAAKLRALDDQGRNG